MGYERNQRGGWQGDGNRDFDYDGGRDNYSSARDYAAAGQYGDRGGQGGGDRYEGRGDREDYGARGYGSRDAYGSRDYYGGGREHGQRRESYGDRERGYGRSQGMSGNERYGSPYQRQGGYSRGEQGRGGYSGQPQGYDYDERDFFSRAGDEVRSWFGDDDAERRREMDRRYDERHGSGSSDRDEHYSNWRRQRISELDRDYNEYRRENASRFENEFNAFRTERQTQRSSLSRVNEHMEVVGSDGEHVGTVDKVRGDRIILTKNDVDAGGRHHSIPSRWIESVDDKVKIRKTAQQAKDEWRDEERNQAMFGDEDRSPAQNRSQTYGADRKTDDNDSSTRGNLNKSFSGTY